MSGLARPPTATAAQARVVDEVLAWGRARPRMPDGLLEALLEALRAGLDEHLAAATVTSERGPGRQVLGVRSLVADATAGSATPLVHDRATVRGILLGSSFARDVERQHEATPAGVVAAVADELAAERPADPASASAWWNAARPAARVELLAEVTDVLADVRTLWPPLPSAYVEVTVRPQLRVGVDHGIVLAARPDVVIDSPRRDDRARALVVMTRTGMPRPPEDRALVRATALVQTLSTGRPPFRWVLLHLTDGRLEVEELDAGVLVDTAGWLGRQAARVATGAGSAG